MLRLVESKREIRSAQKKFELLVRSGWNGNESRLIVWRPDKKQLPIAHDGSYWFASYELDDAANPRFWNSFGIYKEKGSLNISLEINIPTEFKTSRIAGFFAKDETGNLYLMHDGGVGGGRKGVNRNAFLAWLARKPVAVRDVSGSERLAILVTALDSAGASDDLREFVQKAFDFKTAVKAGNLDTPAMRRAVRTFGNYFDEFSGRKRRRALDEVEYLTRHGDVVKALRKWRPLASDKEFEVKDPYIDWGVGVGEKLVELYEVKTNCDRQSLYTAIGQLAVHDSSLDEGCRRILVVPNGGLIPSDVQAAMRRMNIAVVRFVLGEKTARIISNPF